MEHQRAQHESRDAITQAVLTGKAEGWEDGEDEDDSRGETSSSCILESSVLTSTRRLGATSHKQDQRRDNKLGRIRQLTTKHNLLKRQLESSK